MNSGISLIKLFTICQFCRRKEPCTNKKKHVIFFKFKDLKVHIYILYIYYTALQE
jgi:hypothetical protein